MKFRHEYKFSISRAEYACLHGRLRAALPLDSHAGENGEYLIRSIYFDNLQDKALREKINGVNNREKFRIRYYNENCSYLMLEKKSKINGLCQKQGQRLSQGQAEKIFTGDLNFLRDSPLGLFRELYIKMQDQRLRPKTIVDYMREPFVFPAGHVRVTLDRDIRTGAFTKDLFSGGAVTVPLEEDTVLLEVKYDEFLPDFIGQIVNISGQRYGAFSKYAACRVYG